MEAQTSTPLVHSLNPKSSSGSSGKFSVGIFIVILFVALLLGGGAGYLGSTFGKPTTIGVEEKGIGGVTKAGVKDEKEFPDKVEGLLKEGGIDGEGNFHLERPGGISQNVYLTSSAVDLSQFVGKKVSVWGQTFEGEKAGWLMDVGYVEVL